jgi:hypothetical protein
MTTSDPAERFQAVRAQIAAASDLLAEHIANADENGRPRPDTPKEH